MTINAARARLTGVESRSMPFRGMELRASSPSNLTFAGYASVTEQPYEMEDWLGAYTEVVRSGAFAKTLTDGADVSFLVNHAGQTLARTKSGTLRLAEDSTGLHVEADLDPSNPDVQGLRSGIERGDLDEMSFAFRVTRQQWSPDYDQRDIQEVSLNKGDVSVVNYGANPHTGGLVSVRGLRAVDALEGDDLLRAMDRLTVRLAESRAITPAQAAAWLGRVAAVDDIVDALQAQMADAAGVPNPDDDARGLITITEQRMEERAPSDDKHPQGLTPAIKSKYIEDLKDSSKNPTAHIADSMRRLAEWAASGHFPVGCTYSDLKWMYDQAADELHRRDPSSKAGGNFPPMGSGSRGVVFPGDSMKRCQAMSAALGAAGESRSLGWFSPDEVRRIEGLPTARWRQIQRRARLIA